MTWRLLAVAAALLPAVARADEPGAPPAHPAEDAAPREAPFAHAIFARSLVGLGGVPDLPTPAVVLTAELGHRPFVGALSTGFTFSSASDLGGLYTVVTPGLMAQLDLTYLFLSGLWARRPPPTFPVRIQLGGRLGMDVSDSFRLKPSYVLVRPELGPFLDVEVPLGRQRRYAVVFRADVVTPVSLDDLFRWSFALGLSYGWGHG